jgi:hypothetical protein
MSDPELKWWQRLTGAPWGGRLGPDEPLPRLLFTGLLVILVVEGVLLLSVIFSGGSVVSALLFAAVIVLLLSPAIARARANGVAPRSKG